MSSHTAIAYAAYSDHADYAAAFAPRIPTRLELAGQRLRRFVLVVGVLGFLLLAVTSTALVSAETARKVAHMFGAD